MLDNKDLIAGVELIAETTEKQVQQQQVTNTRLQYLEKILSKQQPIIKYAETDPARFNKVAGESSESEDQTQQHSPIQTPATKPKSQPDSPNPKPSSNSKFKRKDNSPETWARTITNAGKELSQSVINAGAAFATNTIDKLGNEILPFYNDLKSAGKTIGSGALAAGDIVASKFKRVKDDKPTAPAATTNTETVNNNNSMFEIIRSNKVKEKVDRIREIKKDHADHKLYKKVDDIADMMRTNQLISIIGLMSGGLGKLLGIGSVIAGLTSMVSWLGGAIGGAFAALGSKLSDLWAGAKGMFKELADDVGKKFKSGLKAITDKMPKWAGGTGGDLKTTTPDAKPTTSASPDGKPAGTDPSNADPKKPTAVDAKPETKGKFDRVVSDKTKAALEKRAAGKAAGGVAESVAGKFAQKAAVRAGTGAALGPIGGAAAMVMLANDAYEAGLEATGYERTDKGGYFTRERGEPLWKRKGEMPTAGEIPASAQMEVHEQKIIKADKEEALREKAYRAMSANITNNTQVNNGGKSGPDMSVFGSQFTFVRDHQLDLHPYGVQSLR
ncbi:hypothetical protein [Aeromonas hydrophila]|nr:hypothetical protein [Aeromonas hydrophila]AGM44177.1 hypothetical protein AHML_11985 [Aeromonas hydrophila ML09-119]AHX32850.1 hypothetical protein V428_12370 [Aeromonas hydrophila subsp. hydrophila AL09-71]AHX69648.1 hypothetical protein V429_12385 [Aeromonas hydrophila pc104A]AJE38611.1 hypothetical protein V469_10690 [Aeromonas hydrophila J-1]AKJ37039.1 hypothetical protein U876_11100 [Aeromonas hydrophila NJ-35]